MHDKHRCTEEPCALTRCKHGVRREARHYIPGSTGMHSKEVFGLPANPRPKGRRDRSMLGQGTTVERRCTIGRVSPTDMVKAVLLEPQSPVVNLRTRWKKRLITTANLYTGKNRVPMYLREVGHWPVRPGKGMNGAPTSVSDV
jgi:hypothetical protein